MKQIQTTVVMGNYVGGTFTAAEDGKGESLTLDLYGEIGEYWDGFTLSDVADAILWAGKNIVVIEINLHSPGGSIDEGIAIYHFLRNHPANVTITNIGMACSISCILFLSGDVRIMCTGTETMLHPGKLSGYINATADETIAMGERLKVREEAVKDILVERTLIDRKKADELMSSENYMNVETALELGFATDKYSGDEIDFSNIKKFEPVNVNSVPAAALVHFTQSEKPSTNNKPVGGEEMEYKDLNIEDLKKNRPDLVEAINKQSSDTERARCNSLLVSGGIKVGDSLKTALNDGTSNETFCVQKISEINKADSDDGGQTTDEVPVVTEKDDVTAVSKADGELSSEAEERAILSKNAGITSK